MSACKAASALARKLLCSGRSFGPTPDDGLSPTEEALSLGTDFHSFAGSDRRKGREQEPWGGALLGLSDGCLCNAPSSSEGQFLPFLLTAPSCPENLRV